MRAMLSAMPKTAHERHGITAYAGLDFIKAAFCPLEFNATQLKAHPNFAHLGKDTFDDGTVTEQHLSWKSFRQLVAMKTAQTTTRLAPKSGADTPAPFVQSDAFSKPVTK